MALRQDASTGKMVDDGQPTDPSAAIPAGTLHVKVYSPFRTYYDDIAKSVSAVTKTGPFDILPQHHNFICLLEPCEVSIVRVNGDTQKIKIASGMMRVKADSATVMLDV